MLPGLIESAVIALSLHARLAALPPARVVQVVGMDYQFNMPATLQPGRTIFRFVNKGTVSHELNIVRLAPGVRVEQFVAATNSDTATDATLAAMVEATIGVLFAEPGKHSDAALSTVLLPGRTYAVRCNYKDSASAPRHQALGMFTAIHVKRDRPAPVPEPRADTVVASDYAFSKYPAMLTPGLHDFAFVNSGKQRHEVLLVLLKRGETLQHLFDVAKTGGNTQSVLDGSFGVLHSRAGASPDGLLQVSMLPGREYVIVCTFSDTDKSPPHYALGMVGSIRVSGTPAAP